MRDRNATDCAGPCPDSIGSKWRMLKRIAPPTA